MNMLSRLNPTLRFEDMMDGRYAETVNGKREGAFAMHFDVVCEDLRKPLESIVGDISGKVTVEGIATDAHAEGTLELAPFSKRKLHFKFTFDGDDGKRYRFDGIKPFRFRDPLTSFTYLPKGALYDDATGRKVAQTELRFNLGRDLSRVAKSLTPSVATKPRPRVTLSPNQRAIGVSFARAIIPQGRKLCAGNERTIKGAEAMLHGHLPAAVTGLGVFLQLLDHAAIPWTGRRFSRLSPKKQEKLLLKWEAHGVMRTPLSALAFLFKVTHYDNKGSYSALDAVYDKGGPPKTERWLQQLQHGSAEFAKEDIECDVVVIGTGAGGAVVGRELAEKGHAVVFLEEGELHQRDEFTGSVINAHTNFYRQRGSIIPRGNTFMPVFAGRMVGGSTAINSGTCFRTPDRALNTWCEEMNTDEFSPAKMEQYFQRVEAFLPVEATKDEMAGEIANVIKRGCDELKWRHAPIRRNAPDCDGQGVCTFGCPSDARRSMNLSYIPSALERGAMVFTGSRADRVIIESGRAVGVEAKCKDGSKITVRAKAVIVAGGAIPTPVFLQKQGLANSSGWVGKNLSLHPICAVSALFDAPIMGYNAAPQGYGCSEFYEEGLLLLAASAPPNLGATLLAMSGERLTAVMDNYDRIATMISILVDSSRGTVEATKKGTPRVRYDMSTKDAARLQMGMGYLAELFFAAGAERVFPLTRRMPIIENADGLKSFRKLHLSSRDFTLNSVHPLGTCRMGTDPKDSVVGLDHETHDVPGLFIVDGSTVRSTPGVNPQLTIMTLATRAADQIAARLD